MFHPSILSRAGGDTKTVIQEFFPLRPVVITRPEPSLPKHLLIAGSGMVGCKSFPIVLA